jgi:hypothetical protein
MWANQIDNVTTTIRLNMRRLVTGAGRASSRKVLTFVKPTAIRMRWPGTGKTLVSVVCPTAR